MDTVFSWILVSLSSLRNTDLSHELGWWAGELLAPLTLVPAFTAPSVHKSLPWTRSAAHWEFSKALVALFFVINPFCSVLGSFLYILWIWIFFKAWCAQMYMFTHPSFLELWYLFQCTGSGFSHCGEICLSSICSFCFSGAGVLWWLGPLLSLCFLPPWFPVLNFGFVFWDGLS